MAYSPERRRELIEMALALRSRGKSWTAISDELRVSKATLKKWVRAANSSGMIVERPEDLERLRKLQAAYVEAIERALGFMRSREIDQSQAKALKAVVDVLTQAAKGLAEVEELLAMKRARIGHLAVREEAVRARERAVRAFQPPEDS